MTTAPLIDARRDPRAVALLHWAHLTAPDGDTLCRIRNLSRGGLQVQSPLETKIGAPVRVEMRSGTAIAGHVVWTQHDRAGIAFDEPVDVAELLQQLRPGRAVVRGPRQRSTRFDADLASLLQWRGTLLPERMVDISQNGARMTCHASMSVGDATIAHVPLLGAQAADVRWVRDSEIGMRFLQPLDLRALSAWLVRRDIRFAARR